MKRHDAIRYGFAAYGVVMLTGIVFVFVPQEAMVRIGVALRLPPFEITPVFEYMARGLSLVSFLSGLVMFHFAFHLREQQRLIERVGWIALASIPLAVWIHVTAQIPRWWAAGDVMGLILLWLLCFLSRAIPPS